MDANILSERPTDYMKQGIKCFTATPMKCEKWKLYAWGQQQHKASQGKNNNLKSNFWKLMNVTYYSHRISYPKGFVSSHCPQLLTAVTVTFLRWSNAPCPRKPDLPPWRLPTTNMQLHRTPPDVITNTLCCLITTKVVNDSATSVVLRRCWF